MLASGLKADSGLASEMGVMVRPCRRMATSSGSGRSRLQHQGMASELVFGLLRTAAPQGAQQQQAHDLDDLGRLHR